MLFFLGKGFRVVAHDRRGDGRSSQVAGGHDMDHYAADAAAVVEHLDLRNAVRVGHSTVGGQAPSHLVPRPVALRRHQGILGNRLHRRSENHQRSDADNVIDDDWVVPTADTAFLSVKRLKKGAMKTYDNYPHGMCTTQAEMINAGFASFAGACWHLVRGLP